MPDDLLSAITAVVQDRISTNTTALESHGKDESYRDSRPPQVVVFPESTEEVSEVCTDTLEQAAPQAYARSTHSFLAKQAPA